MRPEDIHARFSKLPGSGQIGSLFAMRGLAFWLERRRPTTVVEIGGGIGALSTVILRNVGEWTAVWVVEPHPWCQEQWKQNVVTACRRVFHASATVPSRHRVDFLVVDGGDQRGDYYRNLAKRALVFVEGGRRPQRAVLEAELRRACRPFARATYRPLWPRTKGYSVYVTNPTAWERVWLASVRLREAILDLVARGLRLPVGKKAQPVDLPAGQIAGGK